jgi:hypothetical protein
VPADLPEIPAVDSLETALDSRERELQSAVDAAFDQAKRKPTQANRRVWRDACAALDRFKSDRRDSGTSAERFFDGPPEALEYLEAQQWKIGKTKFYDDLKNRVIERREDGRISILALDEYTRCLSKLDGTPGHMAGRSLQEQKTIQEIERIRIDREMREVRLHAERGEWVPRSDVEIELAKRTNYLRSDLKNIFRALAGEIIKVTKGDPSTIPALITWGAGEGGAVDEIMDRYSRPIKGFEDD